MSVHCLCYDTALVYLKRFVQNFWRVEKICTLNKDYNYFRGTVKGSIYERSFAIYLHTMKIP